MKIIIRQNNGKLRENISNTKILIFNKHNVGDFFEIIIVTASAWTYKVQYILFYSFSTFFFLSRLWNFNFSWRSIQTRQSENANLYDKAYYSVSIRSGFT